MYGSGGGERLAGTGRGRVRHAIDLMVAGAECMEGGWCLRLIVMYGSGNGESLAAHLRHSAPHVHPQVQMTTTDWDECGFWLGAVKRMIKMRTQPM